MAFRSDKQRKAVMAKRRARMNGKEVTKSFEAGVNLGVINVKWGTQKKQSFLRNRSLVD